MTSVLYFLHLNTLDIILLIVNISVNISVFINKMFLLLLFEDNILHDIFIFNSFLLLLRRLKEEKTKASLCYYVLYNSK